MPGTLRRENRGEKNVVGHAIGERLVLQLWKGGSRAKNLFLPLTIRKRTKETMKKFMVI